MTHLLRHRSDPAPAPMATQLLRTLLSAHFDGAPLWPRPGMATDDRLPAIERLSSRTILVANGLLRTVAEPWADRVQLSDTAIALPAGDPRIVATISDIRRAGRFAEVTLNTSSSSTTYYLLQTADGWRLVRTMRWDS